MFLFPKKSLGQNFLNSPKALADIITASDVKPGDRVLEIGPGRGALTYQLLKVGAEVTAIEKDESLAQFLKDKFYKEIESGRLKIIEGDVLEFDLTSYTSGLLSPSEYKLIANIPYYITGQVFRMFLEGATFQPTLMTLLVQKEVADRVVARNGKESILSLSVKVYGKPEYVATVKRGSFSPAPNVDSAILCVRDISKTFFVDNNINETKFFEIVKAAFAHKRKMIAGNLKEKGFVLPENINQKVRAEDLALDDFALITKENS